MYRLPICTRRTSTSCEQPIHAARSLETSSSCLRRCRLDGGSIRLDRIRHRQLGQPRVSEPHGFASTLPRRSPCATSITHEFDLALRGGPAASSAVSAVTPKAEVQFRTSRPSELGCALMSSRRRPRWPLQTKAAGRLQGGHSLRRRISRSRPSFPSGRCPETSARDGECRVRPPHPGN